MIDQTAPLVRYGSHARVTAGTPCALCGEASAHLVTDHCHRHSWVRGVLCAGCNSAMSYIDRLRAPRAAILRGAVTISDMLAHVQRCPECPQFDASEIDETDNTTPVRRFRLDSDAWDLLGEATAARRSDRSK